MDCKERNEQIVRLPGKHYDDIVELLKLIYPNFMKEIDGKSYFFDFCFLK